MTRFVLCSCMALVAALALAPASAATPDAASPSTNVPQFLAGRLPDESGPLPPDRWSASENVAWKVDVPGLAWSSPIVWDDRVYLTTCINKGKERPPRKGLYLEDVDANKYPKPKDEHEWRVMCYDLNSGEKLWDQLAHAAIPAKPHHIKNTLASETPATDGERIYAYFGNVGLFVYDMDGKPLWAREFEPRSTQYGWGTSISPILHEDRLYIVNDNEEESYVLVLDKVTGEEKMRIDREGEKTNYATPFIWENDQRTELVTSGIGWARSYDLDGNLLWKIKGKSILAIPTPFEYDGLLYLIAGHVLWGENPMYAIRPGASGDISPAKGESANDFVVWSHEKSGPYHPTPIIYDGLLYVLYDRGFMVAFDPKTGEEVYSRKRIPNGRAFTSSPWAYGGKLFCLNEDGVTFVIKAGSDFEVLHKNELAEDDMGMATPVVVGDKRLIRTAKRLYCISPTSVAAKE
ncbi:MAG: serine/threonine protein kinase [Planctomycetota bacterium]|nr:MAG: serine/threonine protein kinase [Planctomycetota bacterium]